MGLNIGADIEILTGFSLVKHLLLNIFQPVGNAVDKIFRGNDFFAFGSAEFQAFFHHNFAAFDIAHADFADNRSPFTGPFPEFVHALAVALIGFAADFLAERGLAAQFFLQFGDIFQNGCFVFGIFDNRNKDNLIRRNPRRNDHSFIIGMRHDYAADKTSRNAPGGGIGIFRLIIGIDKRNIGRFREVLSQKMRCTGL